MTLLAFVVILVVLGICYYLVTRYIPLPEIVVTVLNIVLVLVVICLVLSLLGVINMPFKLS